MSSIDVKWTHARIPAAAHARRHINYIHYNPVKHGLVQRVCDWPWSGFLQYVGMGFYEKEWGVAHGMGANGEVLGSKRGALFTVRCAPQGSGTRAHPTSFYATIIYIIGRIRAYPTLLWGGK